MMICFVVRLMTAGGSWPVVYMV